MGVVYAVYLCRLKNSWYSQANALRMPDGGKTMPSHIRQAIECFSWLYCFWNGSCNVVDFHNDCALSIIVDDKTVCLMGFLFQRHDKYTMPFLSLPPHVPALSNSCAFLLCWSRVIRVIDALYFIIQFHRSFSPARCMSHLDYYGKEKAPLISAHLLFQWAIRANICSRFFLLLLIQIHTTK